MCHLNKFNMIIYHTCIARPHSTDIKEKRVGGGGRVGVEELVSLRGVITGKLERTCLLKKV